MRIKKAKVGDCGTVNSLMEMLIDEIYVKEPEKIRKILKANFTQNALQELCREEHALIYVVEMDEKIVAFLLGWYFHNVLTIYWLYCLKEYRGQGVIKKLLDHTEKKMLAKGCYKLEMYAYAEHNRFLCQTRISERSAA